MNIEVPLLHSGRCPGVCVASCVLWRLSVSSRCHISRRHAGRNSFARAAGSRRRCFYFLSAWNPTTMKNPPGGDQQGSRCPVRQLDAHHHGSLSRKGSWHSLRNDRCQALPRCELGQRRHDRGRGVKNCGRPPSVAASAISADRRHGKPAQATAPLNRGPGRCAYEWPTPSKGVGRRGTIPTNPLCSQRTGCQLDLPPGRSSRPGPPPSDPAGPENDWA